MKAIVFTMDSIFALAIAVTGISILLFFQYSSQAPYSLQYSNVQAILANLASTSVESVSNSSIVAKSLAIRYGGINETWPMFLGGPSSNSSGGVGPAYPVLAYVFNPSNTITTGIVAGYGNVYFAANSILYALNATTNRTAWTINTISNVVNTPALYSGLLFYANATNLTAVFPTTGSVLWTTNSIRTISITTPLLAYNNEIVFGGSDNKVYAYLASNGTQQMAYGIGSTAVSIAVSGGNLVIKTNTGTVYTAVQSGANLVVLSTTAYAAGNTPTRFANQGNKIYLGTGSSANAIYINGTAAAGFPAGTGSTITGVAAYQNNIVYQTGSGVVSLSPTGSQHWSAAVPAYFGGSIVNATPVVTGTMVYTLWANGLAGENLTSGTIQWFAEMPGAISYPYMTLAYGMLYVEANNRIMVYGSCYSPPYATLLSAAATMFLNGQRGCGTALLNSVYPATNYAMFVNSPSANSIGVAHFNGAKGYITARNSGLLNNSYVAVSFWINVSSAPPSGVRLVNYGDNGTCTDTSGYCGWFFYLSNSMQIQFNVMNGRQISANGIVLNTNRWYMVTGETNGTVALYINANAPYTQAAANVVATASYTSPNIQLTIGAGLPSDTRYFTGNIANVQIYYMPMNRQQISALYREGVNGVPLPKAGLVAWYPLEGDPNDYANFNTGFVVGSTKFVTSTYTSPAFANAYQISRASTLIPVINYTSGAGSTINVGVYSWS
jgi:hypothetical protein